MKRLYSINMRVALVHDDLVQWGGAEKVLAALSEVLPDAPIYTSVFNKENFLLSAAFRDKRVITSFLQSIPGWKGLYKALLPLYPLAFEQFDFTDYDLVISQTTRFAKSIVTKPETVHITYCHTPPRFLWHYSSKKEPRILQPYLSCLRIFDQISSKRPDYFLAGSLNAKERIRDVYKTSSQILEPFVDTDFFNPDNIFDGGYFLLIARLVDYKRVDIVVKAFNKNGLQLKIVGKGPEANNLRLMAKNNIEILNGVSDTLLINLIKGCKGLIVSAEEDFGMTPLEAQACGKPVIAYKKGGLIETVLEGETGVFFSQQSPEDLNLALEKFLKIKFDSSKCRQQAVKFSKARFKSRLKELLEQKGFFCV